MLLTPTKALSHLSEAFQKMYDGFKLYGHEYPKLFYTDNPKGDQAFLEAMLPSLTENVKPLPDSAETTIEDHHMDTLNLPSNISVHVTKSIEAIGEKCSSILQDTKRSPDDDRPTKIVHIGLDCEWPVSFRKDAPRQKVSLVQLAYKDNVFLFQLRKGIRKLPGALVTLLQSSYVMKHGVRVKNDIQYLLEDYGEDPTTVDGFCDSAKFCFENNIGKRANQSLAKVCELVLHKKLEKPEDIRVSEDWGSLDLTPAQKKYAALDAWASLCVYQTVSKGGIYGGKINSAQTGVHVGIYSGLVGKASAHGVIATEDERISYWDKILREAPESSLLKKKDKYLVINVTRVLIPGAFVDAYDVSKCLGDQGAPSFLILCDKSKIKTVNPNDMKESNNSLAEAAPVTSFTNATHAQLLKPHELRINDTNDSLEEEIDADESVFNAALEQMLNELDDTDEEESLMDESEEIESEVDTSMNEDKRAYYTRVLKDIFHLMEMLPISLKHGMSKEFKRRFRDALFIIDKNDIKQVEEKYLSKNNDITWDDLMLNKPKWVLRRVRRYVPAPDKLYPVVNELFETMGPSVCSRTGNKLFDEQTRKVARNVLEYIRKGYVSDPIGIPLYYKMGVDSYGLTIYRCARGTNSVEGSVHQNIIRKFASFNTSPELADCALADYRLRHNTDVRDTISLNNQSINL